MDPRIEVVEGSKGSLLQEESAREEAFIATNVLADLFIHEGAKHRRLQSGDTTTSPFHDKVDLEEMEAE